MVRPRDTSAASYAVQLDIYRRLGSAGRARLAEAMSHDTRELMRAGIRSRHPEYLETDVEEALRRLLYGDTLYLRAWPARRLLEP